jgi:hypothetical protein
MWSRTICNRTIYCRTIYCRTIYSRAIWFRTIWSRAIGQKTRAPASVAIIHVQCVWNRQRGKKPNELHLHSAKRKRWRFASTTMERTLTLTRDRFESGHFRRKLFGWILSLAFRTNCQPERTDTKLPIWVLWDSNLGFEWIFKPF